MTTPYYCLFIAVLLPYMIAFSSVYFRKQQTGTLNLSQPRTQADQLVDKGARMNAAQYNAWEALMVFVSALFVATTANVDADTMANASMLFVAARILHPIFYVAGIIPLRLLAFTAGIGSCMWLFAAALL